MSKSISSRTGRLWLMGITIACFLGAMLSVFLIARGDAIHSTMLQDAAGKLLGFYLPLLSLIGVFFFTGRKNSDKSKTPIEAFLFAIIVTSLWVSMPLLFLWLGGYIEDVLASIEKFKPFGDTIVLAALGYFFSKGG